jgi:DNA recombination protein RmuC
MADTAYLIIGLIIGGISIWLMMHGGKAVINELRGQVASKENELSALRKELDSEKKGKVESQTRLDEARKSFEEQKALIDAMKTEMTDTFNALSSAALKSSSEDFLRLASENLGKIAAETKGKLGEHNAQMEGLINPLQQSLKKYEELVHSIEVKRKQEYTSLDEQIKMLSLTHRELQKETGNLVTALRKPHVRGRWGEVTLRNVVELAGMSAHCDFTEQLSINTESGRLRPDLIIHLPGGRDIVVDSKVAMDALLDAASASTEEQKKEALKRHGQHLKKHIDMLSKKEYWSQFEMSPELTVAFISESALVAALEADSTIMEDSMSKRVLIATPTSLFALLTAFAYGWRQEQVTKNAEEISRLGKELYERIATFINSHFMPLGSALSKAIDSYNRSAASFDTRVLPSVRKFKELGATTAEELPSPEQVEQTPKNLNLIEPEQ